MLYSQPFRCVIRFMGGGASDAGVFNGLGFFLVLLLKKFEIVPGGGDGFAMQDAFIAGENITSELGEPSRTDTWSRGHSDVLREPRNDLTRFQIDTFVMNRCRVTCDLFQNIASCVGRSFCGEVANEALTTAPEAFKSSTLPERIALVVPGVDFTIL